MPLTELCAIGQNPLGLAVQPVFSPPSCLLTQLMLLQLVNEGLWETVSNAILKLRYSMCSSLQVSHLIAEAVLGKNDFLFVNPCVLLPITFLSFVCLEMKYEVLHHFQVLRYFLVLPSCLSE